VAEIGAQQLSNSFLRATSQINDLGSLYGKSSGYKAPHPLGSALSPKGYEPQHQSAPYAKPFWEWLGYRYLAIDIDESPDSLPLDLNFDEVPFHAVKQCHLVTNYGTTEHVANQCQAFKIIHDLTAVRGVMVHHLPAQGMFNHGLVNYNPKFFWMLSRSNNYKFLFMDFTHDPEQHELPENVMHFVKQSDERNAERAKQYRFSDAALMVAVQKVEDIEFVPPIDVQTGSTTNNDDLRRRYWTVFKSQPVERPSTIMQRLNAVYGKGDRKQAQS
jgi:hypothetical protein